MIALALQGIAMDLGIALLHSLWQVAAVAAALWGLLTLLHRASPNLRHALAMLALSVAVLWPAGTFLRARQARQTRIFAIARGPQFVDATPLPSSPMRSQPALAGRIVAWSQPALPWLALLWGLGVLGLGARLAGGWLWLRKLRRVTGPAPEWVLDLGKDLARRMGLPMPSLRLADGISGPFGFGLWQTFVVLPVACLAQMDARALEALLAHEFAHLRRHDFLTNAVQSVAELLLFHHPLAHWISSAARLERERCCDLAASTVCGDPSFLAAVLNQLDDLRPAGTSLQLALRAQGAPLMTRIQHLLGASAAPSLPSFAGAALVLAGLGLAAAVTPFQDGAKGPMILVPSALLKKVDAAAKAEGLDPDLVRAIIQCESAYNPMAKSRMGSMGLMQLMPQTAARFGAKDPWQVDQNLQAGAKYLRFLLDHYKGDTARAVTAYNAGSNAVDQSGGMAPNEESRLYAKAVMNVYQAKAIQPTEGAEGVQLIQARLSKQEDGSWNLRMEGWVMGNQKAEVTQPGAGGNPPLVNFIAGRTEMSPYYSMPTISVPTFIFHASPENGPLKIVFQDLGSKRKGEATVPLAAGDFVLELKR